MTRPDPDDLLLDMIAVAQARLPRLEPPTLPCPICTAPMGIASEQMLAEFGELGITLHRLHCSECGMRTDRAFHPSVGYRPISL